MSTSSSSESVVNENPKRKRSTTDKQNENSDTSDDQAGANLDEELENTDDQPVLSHAEKRRRKREAKRAEKLKDGDEHPKKKRKLKGGTSQIVDSPTTTTTTTKRQHSVWVGNLSYKTQHENLQNFFKWVGEITRIHMPMKVRGGPGAQPENRGFAYVDFATPEAKVAAVALSEQPLLGRKLLIKDGDDFNGRPATAALEAVVTDPSIAQKTHSKTAQKIISAQKKSAAPTLFFGNLPFQTTEDEIRQLLDAHKPQDKMKGKEGDDGDEETQKDWIRKIRMGTFEDSGLCKGFAFVDFISIDSSTAALINPKNHHLNGRDLVVEYASPDAVRRGGGAIPRKRRPLSAGYKKTRGRKKAGEALQDGGSGKKSESTTQERDHPPPAEKDSKKKFGKDSERSNSFSTGRGAQRGKEGTKSRPRPGAALAQAKRETAAIVPSLGKKIVF